MRRVVMGLIGGVGGYLVAAVAGYFVVTQFSSNMHDRELEAAMTSAFVVGPIGAIVFAIAGAIAGGKRTASAPRP